MSAEEQELVEVMADGFGAYWGMAPDDLVSRFEIKGGGAQKPGAYLVGPLRAALQAAKAAGYTISRSRVGIVHERERSSKGSSMACYAVAFGSLPRPSRLATGAFRL